jgi:hypothetical protein
MPTVNLGLVKGLFAQTTAPTRTDVSWLDTSVVPNILKTYSTLTASWEAVIGATPITLSGSSLTRTEFEGLTLEQIQTNFRLFRDGGELITLEATTLTEDGTIDFGFDYSGPAFLVRYNLPV